MDYIFLDQKSIQEVNRLLDLPATGKEQDWELELADPLRVGDFLGVLKSGRLNNDADLEFAVAVLCIASLDDAISAGLPVKALADVRDYLSGNKELKAKVFAYFFRQRGVPMNEKEIERLFV